MKKIILTAIVIIACSLTGVAQDVQKALSNGKWYAKSELGSKTIILTKNATTNWVFDMQLLNETAMQYGKIAAADLVNNEGGVVKAGTYYTEPNYGYKITGNSLWIRFAPNEWTYTVKPLKNGDLSLELVTAPTKSTK